MMRPIASIILLAALTGCKGTGQTGAVDPFFGRTRVEPPRTGSVSGQSSDPSYSPAALPNPLRSPSPTVPSTPSASPATRPGLSSGWTPPQSRPETTPIVAATALPSATAPVPQDAIPPGGGYSFSGKPPEVTGVATMAPGDQIAIPSAALTLTQLPRPTAAPVAPAAPATVVSAQPVSLTATPSVTSASPVQATATPTSLSAVPTMSRPTVNALATRERITRTLDPRPRINYGTSSGLPCPIDPVPAVSAMPAVTPTASIPNRVIDITELPVGGIAPSVRGVN